ncbi:hypothetical protein XENTR_v10010331 [Xenopus tropicalis]|uniref:Phospholipid scramblase 1 isoform X1 n=1 Tax=Xenopus tropicalis TaxID=8364 RepID=A0A8J0R7Q0_XENTR|nr:phospholipid scramblase 1 isoform X1 [Xenopus tropicalis]XP_004919597.1 phospholipid scramblase 1 isoform X1 [Xenopus tropicalis]KAE8620566.1 hypothetical protein XENTR_v10010331 [Xenopus tropicalis]KAE8620567.1 hypothetical protein XENTR_v10010331 [Xenopus tropicalis]KAE8620568.1 hypothetical protein XENTR_v10010331 [Xenopus tropicalis]|eukprot:XP_004919596.1 PREDICTED: phospholipid scramblase 1-like isoform X1 [Xenopus tropicalis]
MSNNVQDPAMPIQMQPQWHSVSGTPQEYSGPHPIVPPGLEPLLEVDEVTLDGNVIQSPGGRILYSIHEDWKCCGTPLILKFEDPCRQEVVHAHLLPERGGYSVYKELQIEAPPPHPVGFVRHNHTAIYDGLKFFIQDGQRKPLFKSDISFSTFCNNSIEIGLIGSAHVVSSITKPEAKGFPVRIQFPRDLQAKMKAVIIVTYLYMNYWVDEINRAECAAADPEGGGG